MTKPHAQHPVLPLFNLTSLAFGRPQPAPQAGGPGRCSLEYG
jgi:hypothetical protein